MANQKRGYYSTKLGGKNRTLHFSFNFWANLTDALGIQLEEIGEIFEKGFNMAAFRSLIYSGLLANDQEQGNEVDYNEFTVGSWLDDIEPDEIEKILKAMTETRILGNDLNMGIARNADSKEKKNQPATKANPKNN
jgi:hypothetical protein